MHQEWPFCASQPAVLFVQRRYSNAMRSGHIESGTESGYAGVASEGPKREARWRKRRRAALFREDHQFARLRPKRIMTPPMIYGSQHPDQRVGRILMMRSVDLRPLLCYWTRISFEATRSCAAETRTVSKIRRFQHELNIASRRVDTMDVVWCAISLRHFCCGFAVHPSDSPP